MNILDVFNADAFKAVSMTVGVNKIPEFPTWLESLGIFRTVPITTTTAVVEDRLGRLGLVKNQERGSYATADQTKPQRKARSFVTAHLPQIDTIMAADIESIRAFGSADRLEAIAEKVVEVQTSLKDNIRLTKEIHRLGAISGQVLDSDLSTVIYNYFTEFGKTETSIAVDFAGTSAALYTKLSNDLKRGMQKKLGGVPMSGVMVLCGDTFWDTLVTSTHVEAAYNRYQESMMLRDDPYDMGVFRYRGIDWVNYQGEFGSNQVIADNKARAFPLGVKDLFLEINAPADYVESVNTSGLPFYSKQERMKFDKGVEVEVQANPLMLPTRPEALFELTLGS